MKISKFNRKIKRRLTTRTQCSPKKKNMRTAEALKKAKLTKYSKLLSMEQYHDEDEDQTNY
jgi:hypothetical protein